MNIVTRAAPLLFVALWHTGFIGGRLGLPHAEPLTLLLYRFIAASAILSLAAFFVRAPWPKGWQAVHLGLSGLLLHGVYLGGIFYGISVGVSAGVTSLIASLQPLLTAVLAGPLLGEKVGGRQWLGLVLGLVGVSCVLFEKLTSAHLPLGGLAACFMGLIAITYGTLHQKKYGGTGDLRTMTAWQYLVCVAFYLPVVPLLENFHVEWTGEFIFAFTWLTLVLSVGTIALYFWLIRRGSAAGVASLMYLVPPLTAITAYFLFDERLGILALIGIAIAATGVAIVNAKPAKPRTA
ncbi:DMT family transporter [Lacibacterium aquatile]|uniref:DMT family transporter n=1 Tax=Lacibacterium aquatile TaxID=1168082 RepID=A0ABW5DU15_9PROT